MMANLSIINILPSPVSDIYIKLKSITSKVHNTSASIAFIKKVLFVVVITKCSWYYSSNTVEFGIWKSVQYGGSRQ